MIEDVLVALGHSLAQSRLASKDGSSSWRVKKGSAFVNVVLYTRKEENFLQVAAPVMHLDAKVNREKLFARLLELNGTAVYGTAFSLKGEEVILVAERSTVDLDRSEILDLVRRVEEYGDKYDDELVLEFGGRKAGLSAAPVD
jgi:hypothetical protein